MSHCEVRKILHRIEQSVPRRLLNTDTDSEDEAPPVRRNVNAFQGLAVDTNSDNSLSDVELESDSEPDFDHEHGAERAPDLVPEREVEPEPEFDPEREYESENYFDSEHESESENDSHPERDSDSENNFNPDREAERKPDIDPTNEDERKPDFDPKREDESNSDFGAKRKDECKPDFDPKRKDESNSDFGAKRKDECKPDFDPKRKAELESKLKHECELEPELEFKVKVESELAHNFKPEPQPELEMAQKPESEAKLEVKIDIKVVCKPSRKSRRRSNRRMRRALDNGEPADSTSKEDDETSEDASRQGLSQDIQILHEDSSEPDNTSLPDRQPVQEKAAVMKLYNAYDNSDSDAIYPVIRNSLTSPGSVYLEEQYSPRSTMMSPTPPYDSDASFLPIEGIDEILLTVKPNHLLVTADMSQRLVAGDADLNNRRQTLRERIYRKAMIIEYPELLLNPNNHGLSMSVHRNPDGSQYYTFDHSSDYQKMHRKFLKSLDDRSIDFVLNLDDALNGAHLEALIEIFDTLCRSGEMISAQNLIQRVIAIMQYSAMPSFNISDFQTRLPYIYVENRAFHILVLKYIYLLSNKACHSNALELCKMLVNLDPSDPLGLMFIVDTIAIRAREFEWLIDVLDFWAYKKSAHFMFNLVFSHALAFFQCTRKSTKDPTNHNFANELLRNAIVRFPYVVTALVNNISSPAVETLKNYTLYKVLAPVSVTPSFMKLIEIYAKLIWPRWNERFVITWFIHNARVMAELFETDAEVQNMILTYADSHVSLFGTTPVELSRHLCIIKPISSWIMDADAEVPVVNAYFSFDPIPPADGVDRNAYNGRTTSPVPRPTHWYEFFTSILPSWDPGA